MKNLKLIYNWRTYWVKEPDHTEIPALNLKTMQNKDKDPLNNVFSNIVTEIRETNAPEAYTVYNNRMMICNLPCMSTYPLVNYGHSSIFKELQVFYWGLKSHHFW